MIDDQLLINNSTRPVPSKGYEANPISIAKDDRETGYRVDGRVDGRHLYHRWPGGHGILGLN